MDKQLILNCCLLLFVLSLLHANNSSSIKARNAVKADLKKILMRQSHVINSLGFKVTTIAVKVKTDL